MRKIFTILIVSIFFVYSGVCFAGSSKGLSKKGGTTKGFTQGEKTGWDGENPKGWDQKDKKEKEEWCKKNGLEMDEEGKLKKVQEKEQSKKQNKKQNKSKKRNKKK